MNTRKGRASRIEAIGAVALGVLLLTGFFFGGASRADVMSLPVVRLAAIAALVVACSRFTHESFRSVKLPLLFLLASAILIAFQLVPLPYPIWANLPGRSIYTSGFSLAALPVVWRPISLTPDLTINSFLAMLPPLSVVALMGRLERDRLHWIVPLLLAAVVLSGLLALLQISSGGPYFYAVTNDNAGVGLFANRNHLALFLAMGFPLLPLWTASREGIVPREFRFWISLCVAVTIFPFLLVTGSRAGLIVGGVGAISAIVLHKSRYVGEQKRKRSRAEWLALLLPLLIGVCAVAAIFFLDRDVALRRLVESDQLENRFRLLPVFSNMAADFFPFGSGFGSFDAVYRAYEPAQGLSLSYLNHAHNDFFQLIIEGGLGGGLLLVAFGAWFGARSWRLWSQRGVSSADLYGRTGSVIVIIILIGSAVDYPLRTPFIAMIMALACCWMAKARR